MVTNETAMAANARHLWESSKTSVGMGGSGRFGSVLGAVNARRPECAALPRGVASGEFYTRTRGQPVAEFARSAASRRMATGYVLCLGLHSLRREAGIVSSVKILILGDSGSSGVLTGGVSWTDILRDRVSGLAGEDVETKHSTFVPTGERAPGIAAARVEEHHPDVVVVPVGNYVFSAPFVWLRVQRLFGRRAGRWFRGIEQRVESVTYEKGNFRQRVNSGLRALAQKVIGAEPITTAEESAACYEETFRRLAQTEDIQVVVVTHGGRRQIYKDPEKAAQRTRYMAAVRASAEQHRFLFVQTAAAFAGDLGTGESIQSDGLHGNVSYQSVMGEFVADAYEAHVAAQQRVPAQAKPRTEH